MAPDGLFAAYKEVLDEHGILFISDEVQTGWGRTGEHFWGIGAHGVTPDVMTFAKGLGNGFAIGGVVARGDLLDGIRGNGISTFGGNPVATAAGNATLDYLLSHDLQRNAKVTGDLIISGLREAAQNLDVVGEVRGKGLMFGVDLVDPATTKPSPPLAAKMLEATKRARPADRQGRPVRPHAADGPAADPDRGRGQGRPGHPDRRPRRGERGGKRTSDTKHITHWIDGKPWDGAAGRHGDIYDPATGQVSGQVDFAAPAEVDAAVGRGQGPPGLAAHLADQARLGAVRVPQPGRRTPENLAQLITAEHGKVASDAAGEVARGLEVVEFACGIPHLLKGGFSENVSTGVDVVLDPAAGRRGRRHHPVQLPGHGADVDVPDRHRLRQHVRAQAVREGPVGVAAAGRAVGRGRAARRRVQRGAGRQGGGRRASWPTPTSRRSASSARRPIARYVYENGTAHGKRVQALGGAKNHMVVLPDADLDLAADAAVSAGFGSAGERCMAVSALVAVDPVGDDLVARIAERVAGLRVGPGTDDRSDMGPLVTGAHRDKVASYLDSGVREGATLAVDGRVHPVIDGAPDGFWLGPSCSTTSRRR